MDFKQWLFEVGMGVGVGSGMSPLQQRPMPTAMPTYYADIDVEKDPRNQNGQLPPVTRKKKKK